MLGLLQSGLDFVLGLLAAAWGLLILVAGFGWEILTYLHVESPRLEGLLVGITLAWLLLRRDRHPLLRVLSAPLKLILDILDLAWDQCVEVVGDVWGVARGWVVGSIGWGRDKVVAGYGWLMDRLRSIKSTVSKKEDGE